MINSFNQFCLNRLGEVSLEFFPDKNFYVVFVIIIFIINYPSFSYLSSLFLFRGLLWQDNSTTNFGFPLQSLSDFRRLQFTISRRICGICLWLPPDRHVLATLQQSQTLKLYFIQYLGVDSMKILGERGTRMTILVELGIDGLTLNWWSRLIVLEN